MLMVEKRKLPFNEHADEILLDVLGMSEGEVSRLIDGLPAPSCFRCPASRLGSPLCQVVNDPARRRGHRLLAYRTMGSASAFTRQCWTNSGASPSTSARQGTRSVKLYRSLAERRADLDQWLRPYAEVRTPLGRWCYDADANLP
jgi:hypothetical protein